MHVAYFDLDGTLLDSGRCSIISTAQVFREMVGIEVSEQQILDRMGIPIEVSFLEFGAGRVTEHNRTALLDRFREIYRTNALKHILPFPGIREMLAETKKISIASVIVTSKKQKVATENLAHSGLLDEFRLVVGSDMVERYKPAPDPIYCARRLLSKSPRLEVLIGDADSDIAMGKSAGIITVAVTWGAHSRERLEASSPDFIVTEPAALTDVLIRLFNSSGNLAS